MSDSEFTKSQRFILQILIRICGALASQNPQTLQSTAIDCRKQIEKALEVRK